MPYRYLNASEGDYTIRSDTGEHHSEGFVVYDAETNEERGVYPTEEEARQACNELNRNEAAS